MMLLLSTDDAAADDDDDDDEVADAADVTAVAEETSGLILEVGEGSPREKVVQ